MPVIDDTEPVRGYKIPVEENKLRDDVARLRDALTAIGIDMGDVLAGLLLKAAAVHTHPMTDIVGLVAALAGKVDVGTTLGLNDLSDVDVSEAFNGALLKRSGSKWIPGSVLLADITGWEATVNALIATAIASAAASLGKRGRVRAATTGNISISTTLNAGDSIDGVSLADGDLVLVKSQTTASQNGVYVVGSAPARSSEFDAWDEFPGALIAVAEGTTNADTIWLCTSNAGGTLGSSTLAFSKLNVAGELFAANNLSDLANAAAAVANLGLANALLSNVSAMLTAGFTATAADDGNSGTAAYTPNPSTGNFRKRVNTGAHQFNAPTAAGDYTIIEHMTNGTGAGAVTFAGFTADPDGASLTTTVGHKFLLFITKINGDKHLTIVALQ